MSWRLNSLVIVIVWVLAGCGFKPVYQKGNGESLAPELASITVSPVSSDIGQGRPAQLLKAELEDLLRPAGNGHAEKYELLLALRQAKEPMFIEQDRRITRYNLIVTADYTLKEKGTGKELTKGVSRMVGSFDAEDSDFSTFAAEQDTLRRAVVEIARNIQHRLSAYFTGR